MATANERKALWFLALVALSGSGVRMWRASRPAVDPAAAAAVEQQLARLDSVRQRSRRADALTPPQRGRRSRATGAPDTGQRTARAPLPATMGPIDVDRADAAAIEALPGIGPALAARIVANRDSAGPFGAVEALCDVRGIGPKLVEKLRPMVTFTGPRRPVSDACGKASARARKTTSARARKGP